MDDRRTLSDKLSGRYRLAEDSGGKKTLVGMLLPSPVPRGRIMSLDLPEAPDGVVSIIGRDIPGTSKISFAGETVPVLCGRNILWQGQPLLAAAGPDADELEDWLSRITPDIRIPEDAAEPDENLLIFEKGRPSDGFASAFQVVEESMSVPSRPVISGSRGVSCLRDGSAYLIHAATSWPGAVRRSVSRILKISRENVRVRPYPVKPGSNCETWQPALEAGRTALLAWAARKSVKMMIPPSDPMHRYPVTPDASFHIRGAVDGEGRILAMEADCTVRCGAAFPLVNEFVNRMVMGLFSIYPCRNYIVRVHLEREDSPPSSYGPAAGFELGFLAGELFATSVAEHSLIPAGIWRGGAFPVAGQAYGPGIAMPREFPMNEILGRVLEISDFERKNAAFEQTRLGRGNLTMNPDRYRGIGLACAWFGNGFVTSPKELGPASVTVTLDKEGILSIDIPIHTAGGALQRAWAGMAGEILGIETSSIRFATELAPARSDPGPSILGRNVSVYTRLIEQACNDLAKRRFRDALPIRVERTRRRTVRQPWNPETFEGMPFESVSWGAGVVEVSYSTRTGTVQPLEVWMVIDGGTILMPAHAESAVEASVENALNWCRSGSHRAESPLMNVEFLSAPAKKASRDVASLPWLLFPAAFVKAVRQASGQDIHALPVGPESMKTGGFCP